MGKTKDLGHLAHIVVYDAENHITVPAGITMHTNQLVASQAWVTTALGSYALSSALGSYVPTSRTITINGTTFDLSANRSWTITAGISSVSGTSPINVSTTSGAATVSISQANTSTNGFLSSTDWNTFNGKQNALTIGNIISSDSNLMTVTGGTGAIIGSGVSLLVLPSAIVASGISSTLVTTALGYTPVTNARTITINGTSFDLSANRSWTITATETDTLATVTGRGATTSTALTLSGRVTFASSVSDRPQFPGGILGLDTSDGNFDIWGISREYYPSNPSTANAWGLRWNGTNNDFEFVGGGVSRVILDMDGGNITATGTFSASNYSGTHSGTSSGTNTGDQTNISGNAATATNVAWSGVTSKPSHIMYYQSFTLDANTMDVNATGFTYSVNAPFTGPIVRFSAGGSYDLWLNATYGGGGNSIAFRTRNGDAGAYNPWREIIHTGNIGSQKVDGAMKLWAVTHPTDYYMTHSWTGSHWYLTTNHPSPVRVGYADSAGYSDAVYWSGNQRLYGGSDGTRNTGWAYHMDNGTGLHWPNNGWHLMPASTTDFRIHSGNSSESCLRMETGGTTRGYVYVNSSNQIGFLNNERSWVVKISNDGNIVMDYNFGVSITGVYSSTRYQGVWSMGNAYRLPADGTTTGNLYGLAWSHPNAGGVAGNLNDHGLLVLINGGFAASISSSIRAASDMRAPIFYDQNDTGYYLDLNSTSNSAMRIRGGTLYGPNPTWGAYLYVGTNGRPGNEACVCATNGNLHMDSANGYDIYLNHYSTGQVRMGGPVNVSGNNVFGVNSMATSEYRGNANVGGTGEATWHPAGIYCGSTMWQYGAMYKNNTAIHDVDNIYNRGWFRNYGDSGLYNQDYGCHLVRNSQSSHGSWSMYGYTKAGYVGLNLQDPSGFNNNLMFEQGRGGVYQENGGGWHFYYDRPNDCIGLSGSETYDWVRACTNGKHRITNDTWCDATSWAYAFSYISDGRLKENIITVDSALDKVLQLRGVYYNWIIDTENKKHIGLIAQETAEVCPEVVNYHEETDTYSVNYGDLSGLFVESTKELNQKLMDANARIELLETKLNQLLNA